MNRHLNEVIDSESVPEPSKPVKRFRWQVIPGTLLFIFGLFMPIGGATMAAMVWSYRVKGHEEYMGADVPYWCIYIVVALLVAGLLMLAAAINWFRCQTLRALLLTVAALIIYAVAAYYAQARFPDI